MPINSSSQRPEAETLSRALSTVLNSCWVTSGQSFPFLGPGLPLCGPARARCKVLTHPHGLDAPTSPHHSWFWVLGTDGQGGTDTCVCMAESLCRPLETITTLLIGYTPIQNKKLKKKNHLSKVLSTHVTQFYLLLLKKKTPADRGLT